MTCANCGNEIEPPSSPACPVCEGVRGIRRPGERIARRYRIERLLGRGGMGLVYQVRDEQLEDERLALKVLTAERAGSDTVSRRFKQEVMLARRVTHPNVCRIHEYGTDGDTAFITMELIEGINLRQLVKRHGPLPRTEAVAAAAQVAHGLHAIHQLGIVHRDLKTANLMRDGAGTVRIMDFGIARRVIQETQGGITGSGVAVGTPRYMSPEQAQGRPLDVRSDVYALGVVFYEILVGRVPFDAADAVGILYKHVHEDPPLDGGRAGVPQDLVAVLRKSLAKRPEDRFLSAEAFAEALLGAQREWLQASAASTSVSSPAQPFPAAPRTGNRSVLIISGAVLLAGAAAGIVLRGRQQTALPAATSSGAVPAAGGGADRVLIKGGTFWMGTQSEEPSRPGYDPDASGRPVEGETDSEAYEQPIHQVSLSDFWIDRYEVTVEQYRRFVEAGLEGYQDKRLWGSAGWAWRMRVNQTAPAAWKEQLRHLDWPVVNVTWYEADAYCRWISRESGQQVMLPTEAQWEFAARGPRDRKYPWGSDRPTERHANIDNRVGHPLPGGAYPLDVTPEGVHDLAGNVREWCRDYLGSYTAEAQVDPIGPQEPALPRALRGGAFGFSPNLARGAYRYDFSPNFVYSHIGFRCVSAGPGVAVR